MGRTHPPPPTTQVYGENNLQPASPLAMLRTHDNNTGDTMHRIILAAILLTGCANNTETAQRWADSKYNRCVDSIHSRQKDGERIVWRLEIDACMGVQSEEYEAYKASKEDKLPTRAEFEAQ